MAICAGSVALEWEKKNHAVNQLKRYIVKQIVRFL